MTYVTEPRVFARTVDGGNHKLELDDIEIVTRLVTGGTVWLKKADGGYVASAHIVSLSIEYVGVVT